MAPRKPTVKLVLQTLKGDGSGAGVSVHKRWLGCARQAYYYAKAASGDSECRRLEKASHTTALLTGTIVHALLEMYYGRRRDKALVMDVRAVSFMDDVGDPIDVTAEARLEAETLFRAYRVEFPPTELGEVVAVERLLKMDTLASAFGCTLPITAKVDLAVRLSKADVKRLMTTRAIKTHPGLWLVDHKTDTMKREWYREAFMNEVQFYAYMLIWEAVTGKRPEGLIVNVIGKTKKHPTFESLVVPYPTYSQQLATEVFFQSAQAAMKTRGMLPRPNITHCFAQRPCPFLSICTRY